MNIFIDGKNSLSNKHVNEFIKDLSEDKIIKIHLEELDTELEVTLKELKSFLRSLALEKIITNSEKIKFISDDKVLEFLGEDFNKWTEDVTSSKFGKLNKLFKEPKTKEIKEDEEIIVYCGILEDNKIIDIVSFKGKNKELVEFMNKYYSKYEIKTYFKNKTVFCFESDIDNLENWKTLSELIKEEVIEIKGEPNET